KGQVMLITNGIKIVGCMLMLITVHPLAAYAIVGFGAAAYSPAKYGILTELLPPQQLVIANGWIEGTTVASIILGVLTGGLLIGLIVISTIFGTQPVTGMVLMVAIGACAGFFVVPMNALLQHRGHVLMGAGHSIAVQNFNENIGILAMVGIYSLMLSAGLDIDTAVVLFGLFVSGTMVLVMWRHRKNQARGDLLHLIGT